MAAAASALTQYLQHVYDDISMYAVEPVVTPERGGDSVSLVQPYKLSKFVLLRLVSEFDFDNFTSRLGILENPHTAFDIAIMLPLFSREVAVLSGFAQFTFAVHALRESRRVGNPVAVDQSEIVSDLMVAACMGLHPRLGGLSILRVVDDEILKMIGLFVRWGQLEASVVQGTGRDWTSRHMGLTNPFYPPPIQRYNVDFLSHHDQLKLEWFDQSNRFVMELNEGNGPQSFHLLPRSNVVVQKISTDSNVLRLVLREDPKHFNAGDDEDFRESNAMVNLVPFGIRTRVMEIHPAGEEDGGADIHWDEAFTSITWLHLKIQLQMNFMPSGFIV